MKTFKRIQGLVLIGLLGVSTVSMSGTGAVRMTNVPRKITTSEQVTEEGERRSFEVERALDFIIADSSLNAEKRLAGDPSATVTQYITGSGDVQKIFSLADEAAKKAALKEDEDPTDEDYIKVYNSTYEKTLLAEMEKFQPKQIDCRLVAKRMVEDMITKNVHRKKQERKEKVVRQAPEEPELIPAFGDFVIVNQPEDSFVKTTVKKLFSARYYTERKDPLSQALVLKQLKTINIVKGKNPGFSCIPTTLANGEFADCGKLILTYNPEVPKEGPLKGKAISFVDPKFWGGKIQPQHQKSLKFSDVMSFDDYVYLDQVSACGLAQVQKGRTDETLGAEQGLWDVLEKNADHEKRKLFGVIRAPELDGTQRYESLDPAQRAIDEFNSKAYQQQVR